MEGLELKNVMSNVFWKGKRVLVTGHTGFKGSWLSLWLHQLGANVVGIALSPDTNPSLFNQIGLGDFIDSKIFDIRQNSLLLSTVHDFKPQVVFHLAAQPLVLRSYREPLETWSVNVMGSLHLLEALKGLVAPCAVVMVTTDKVYENQDWDYGYRESDRLGGNDPYSASKSAAELAIASWRHSFCGAHPYQTNKLGIATARAGNVIGGGDWADDRIIPDAIRALISNNHIGVRNPNSTRPWQHVLEPLHGYMTLAEKILATDMDDSVSRHFCQSFNFGPTLNSNQTVSNLLAQVLIHWPGDWQDISGQHMPHEAHRLNLQIDKAHHRLNWEPRWGFLKTVEKTIDWYRKVNDGVSSLQCCLDDITAYESLG